ncbi:uncharacterized protein [Amphiura filiformis]|uniref:uncharacterized protein n=1 Tax=Amphiura filiformis TaxID=82378 RepID=UPI003B21A534
MHHSASGSIVFLSFKTKSERNDWHDTIVSALRNLQVPIKSDSDEDFTPHRPRVNTEPEQDLAVVRRNSPPNPTREVKTDPIGGAEGFKNVLHELKAKTHTKPENGPESDKPIHPCCLRNHVVSHHHDGRNMIFHPEHHYENVHHVQSEDDWHREIKAKQSTVKLHHQVYTDFHKLTVIQTPQPSNDAPRWPKQRQPSFSKDTTSQNTQDFPSSEPDSTDQAAEPAYMNMHRGNRRSPVENDDRYPNSSSHSYVNDRNSPNYMNYRGTNSSAAFRHPSPPPPQLPERNQSTKHRRSSMKDRPLPQIPQQGATEKEAKVTKQFKRRPSNQYTESPRRLSQHDEDHLPSRSPPLLPPEKGQMLRRSQELLRDEMSQTNGVVKRFNKEDVVGGKIALVECNDNLIVAGWDASIAALTHSLHIGDNLTMVNQQMLSSAEFAQQTMNLTAQDEVSLKLQRIPYGILVTLHKDQPGQTLGIAVDGNEITQIYPNGLVNRQGKIRPQTPGIINSGLLCNYAITEINMRPVGFNATTQQVNEMLRNAGQDISLILHPIDFIQVLKEASAVSNWPCSSS